MSPAIAYPTSISIQMSTEAMASGFRVTTAASTYWQTLGNTQLVDIEMGFADENGEEYLVSYIRSGYIDKIDLTRSRGRSLVNIEGRDAGARLLDRFLEKIYMPSILHTNIGPGLTWPPGVWWPPGGGPIIVPLAKNDILKVIGGNTDQRLPGSMLPHWVPVMRTTTAKAIAEDLGKIAGLGVAWQCRDYMIREEFSVRGTIGSALQQLVSVWQDPEPFKVEITVVNTTIMIRERKLEYTTPDYEITVPDAMIKNLTIERVRGPVYGRVTLTGKPNTSTRPQPYDPNQPTNIGGTIPSVEEKDGESVTLKTYDADGQLVSITERTTTLKQPDGVIIKIYERELDGKTGALVKEETQFNTWTDVAYTAEGAPATQPLQLTQRTSTKTLNKKTGAMRVSHEASTGYAYDSFTHYLEMVSSHIKTLVKEELTETEMKTIGYKDKGRDLVEVTTTVYTRSAKTKRLTLSSVEHQTVNGPRPGGIGPPETYTVGAPNSGLRPEIYETIVSSAAGPLPGVNADPYAINVTLSNPNLNLDDLKYIANKYRQASGKTKYTLSWSSPLIPEFQPGVVVLFRGLRDAYGVPVSLSPARIYEASVNSSRNSLEGQYRAIFWR